MSNTGEGDPPDNCAAFMQLLKEIMERGIPKEKIIGKPATP